MAAFFTFLFIYLFVFFKQGGYRQFMTTLFTCFLKCGLKFTDQIKSGYRRKCKKLNQWHANLYAPWGEDNL